MYTIIYNFFFYLKRKQKKKREENKTTSIWLQKIVDYIEWFYNIPVCNRYKKYPSKRYGLNCNKRSQKVIVSLTSYPKRINTVWITIETLLRQSFKPDKIILWLATDQFDGIESLPTELLNLQKRGLTIRFCDDLRSHKKYYYVMQEYPEDIVILADDDMFYPYDTIKKLMNMHKKFPDDICIMTAQVMEPSFETRPSAWRNPMFKEKFEHSNKIQIFTGSGSLYPPHVFSDEVFNKEVIQTVCPYADDLWLTFMAQRNNTKVTTRYPWRAFPITIYGTATDSLWQINAAEGKNDKQWMLLLDKYSKEQTFERKQVEK